MRNAEPVLGIIRLRRTLESWVLRKAHARFGEGRMEKCSWSNSPAADSTSITAARRGTSSPISPGSLCPSACVTGLTGSDQRDLVLHLRPPRPLGPCGHPNPPEPSGWLSGWPPAVVIVSMILALDSYPLQWVRLVRLVESETDIRRLLGRVAIERGGVLEPSSTNQP